MKPKFLLILLFLTASLSSCQYFSIEDLEKDKDSKESSATTKVIASGLKAPVGIEPDFLGNLWVAEAGTGNNDGQVTLITPKGERFPVIINFPSVIRPDGNIEGTTHLGFNNGSLWILNGVSGRLYRFDLSGFKPGKAPVAATEVYSEDLRTFILEFDFEEDTDDSNVYNLTFDKEGNIYIVDSGANAVIKRDKNGNLSVFATIPNIPNPTEVGEPFLEAVPTGIVFNGKSFFVSSLLGFPFPAGQSRIYEINLNGEIVGFTEGFNSLIDLDITFTKKLVGLELGLFGEAGFTPNTGAIVIALGDKKVRVIDNLNFPTGVKFLGFNKFLVSSILEGNISLVTVGKLKGNTL